jgi:alpha-beta hydrolase superfamily lysophospholipase
MKRLLFIIIALFFVSFAEAREVQLETGTGILYGTLETPESSSSPLAILIISGSGPTDRDGNIQGLQGKNNSLKYLAEALASRGVASLRFDKRGVGKSASSSAREEELRFETYIDDVIAWVNYLQQQAKYTECLILGHSEGSLIGMVAAQRANVRGFISISGSGRPAPELIIEQTRKQLPPDLMRETERILSELKAGRTVESPPPALNVLFRESVQPYLISWFKHEPAKEIAKLDIPVLIIQGSTDIQISVDDAKMLKNGCRRARLLIIEGMNHVLKSDVQKQLASYGDPSLPIPEELVSEILGFINSISKKSPNKSLKGDAAKGRRAP